MMELSDHSILSHLGGLENNSLISILNIDNNKLQVIKHSSYYDLDKFKNLVNEKKKLISILSLNIQCIYAKFYELEAFIEELRNLQYKFNVICLQECWISDQTYSLNIQLPGYDCITRGKSSNDRRGLIIYVDKKFQYEVYLNLNMYEHWEGQIIYLKGEGYPNQ